MTNARMMLMAAVVLAAGLLTAGVGVMGFSATRQENPAPPGNPGQKSSGPAGAPQVAQDPPRPAATKPAADQGPLVMQAEVVDPEGHRLVGADVAVTVWYSRGAGDNESVLERNRTDGAGRVQLEVARERPGARVYYANVWAYQPGRAFATTNVLLTAKAPPAVIHLTLEQPGKWTMTVLGGDDRPIAGLRLTPHKFRRTDRRPAVPLTVPDRWLEPLTVTTDAKGVAILTYLPATIAPLSIRVAGSEVAPHALPLGPPRGNDIVLKLGRTGRVVGIVRTASGAPLVDMPVELWVRGSGTLPAGLIPGFADQRITRDETIRLDPQPLKTGPQGAFQTPPTLLSGSTYRVSIRHEGFVPFVSEWVTLDGDRAVIPPIRLQPLQTLTGQIRDRHGRAVAGARVFLPGGPATATDAQGRFALAGVNPGKTILLVEQTGYRLQGWLVDPSAHAELGALTLVRASEIPGPDMKPLADPIPPDESRALADRLLEPYLHDANEKGDDPPRLAAISALSEFNLDRALALLEGNPFRDDDFRYQNVRESLAAKLAATDPARAEAMVEAIADPLARASALTSVAKALPDSERTRKRALLERATTLLRDRLLQADAGRRLRLIVAIAEQWLDMGQRDSARLVLEDRLMPQAGQTSSDVFQTGLLSQMARLEPDQAAVRLQKLPNALGNPIYRDGALVAVAVQLATEHPAEAERVFNLREARGAQITIRDELRLCQRLARVDPARARRVAASLRGPGAHACAWASVAFGLAAKDKAGASEAIDHAIEEIDRLRTAGPGPDQITRLEGILVMYPTNPAALILPVVERIAPERLSEVFWRAVALHPRIETDRDDLLQSSYIGFECTLLARYDREVAAMLLEPLDSYIRSRTAGTGRRELFTASVITAKACIDPPAAVALLESLTPPRDSRPSDPVYQPRLRLAEVLGLSGERRWMRLWRSTGALVPLED